MIYAGIQVSCSAGGDLSAFTGRVNACVERHGAKVLGNFTVAVGEGVGDVVHLVAYKDWATFGTATEGLAADAEWAKLWDEAGVSIGGISSMVMTPLPESSLK